MASDSTDTDRYPVYLGLWTNWSRGQVLGLTLTLRRQEANLLIAFTAFFIAFIATRFWRIVCFAFHRLYAKATPQNAVYHQRQAILRNSSTPEGGILQLVWLAWANRDRGDRFTPLLMAIVALFCISAFTAAGGLSSQISTAVGTEVLIRSLNCGKFILLSPSKAEMIDNAANYAQQCYSTSTAGTLDCGRFVTKKLTSSVDDRAMCPFKEKMCRSTSKNLRIDSGYISSHEHFGINSPDEFFVRQILHCAPITTTGYTSQRNTSIGNFTLYHYGSVIATPGWLDYVHAAKSIESQYANKSTVISTSDFRPISSIQREDADVTLVFLSAEGVLHSAPSTDEWYRVSPTAANLSEGINSTINTITVYLPLEPASPIGCAKQYQFCHGDIHNCGLLASWVDALSSAARLFNTTAFYSRSNNNSGSSFSYFIAGFTTYQSAPIGELLAQLGPASLASKSSLASSIQGPLPSNQWQLDVTRWWDISMASLQAAYLGMSYYNPPDPSLLKYRTNFTSEAFRKLCNSQKIRSNQYTSFSVFGLLFTYIAGLFIILVSYLLEPISQILYRKWGYRKFAHLEWNAITTLQLQRLAHEQLGFGTWSKGTAEIPLTEAGDLLGCLDISNPDHPLLYPPEQQYRQTLNEGNVDGDSPQNPIAGEAPQLPVIASSAIELGTEANNVQQSDCTETENIFWAASQFEASPNSGGFLPARIERVSVEEAPE
ncbi:hypothetical protein F5Y10DRAFT_291787 [Nemania abortiva]|nr:hypothetical protein F5Y10DRAFT_291787 [Nemania abortiva]